MPRIPGRGTTAGGGAAEPSLQAQAVAARRLWGEIGLAEEPVQVITPGGNTFPGTARPGGQCGNYCDTGFQPGGWDRHQARPDSGSV
jgi:hypothetical protein